MAQASRSIASLMQQLQQRVQMDFDAEEMADILWLALQQNQSAIAPSDSTPTPESPEVVMQPIQPLQPGSENALPSPPEVPITTELPEREDAPEVGTAVPIQIPDTTALPQSLALARSLRPLMRKVASQRIQELDEDATIRQIVDEKIWSPVMRPAPERWLELAIVVEETNLLDVWQETMTEFQALMERHGAFRDVRSWQLVSDVDGSLQLFRRKGKTVARSNPRPPRELLDPTGRRLIIVVSDCTSSAWRSGQLLAQLEQWMLQTPVTVLQLLPERFWGRSVLGLGDAVWLSSSLPGALNQRLEVEGLSSRRKQRLVQPVTLPVVTLEAAPLLQWAKVIAGVGGQETAGVILDRALFSEIVSGDALPPLTPDQLVQRFWRTASPIARKLAGLMAAVPVSWAVIRLIQRNLLPESTTIHVAEIFLSGLLRSLGKATSGSTRYDFVDGVRSRLIDVMPRTDVEIVLDEVADDFLSRLSVDLQERISADIERRIGASLHSFDAFLLPDLLTDLPLDPSMRAEILPFATITSQVLRRLGDEYTELVDRLVRSTPTSEPIPSIELPPLQEFQFRVATIDESDQSYDEHPELQVDDLVEPEDSEDQPIDVEAFCRSLSEQYARSELKDLEQSVSDALERYLENLDLYPEPESSYSYEADSAEVSLLRFKFDVVEEPNQFFRPVDVDTEAIVIEAELSVVVSLEGSVYFTTYDSIDHEDVGIGANSVTIEANLKANALISLTDGFVSPNSELEVGDIEIEVTNLDEIDWGFVDPDYGDPEDNEDVDSGEIGETVQAFEFTVATIEIQAQGRRKPKLVIRREQKQAWQLIEELGETGIRLEMVAIAAGSFVMGSSDDEIDLLAREAPQHEVNVSEFFMSKYPVTQAQWRFVATLPQVHRSLYPDPSRFKGNDRPVEQVSWHDAVEFCERLNRFVEDRLSRFTKKQYRLPSEAEWEYACRAGTTSEFHFGATITSELANYDGRTIYGRGVKGQYRGETTPVGSFGVANEFGLYDMHGNVWEWCEDHWHNNYKGAPSDGSAWINADANENASRVVRGGSWSNVPRYCRSASHSYLAAGRRGLYYGFRVVLSAPRTL